jgi:hypothetical protein
LEKESIPPKSLVWIKIWKFGGILKINRLYWDLSHGRILTVENLAIRGIHGPSRCGLFLVSVETITHLFWECIYIASVWKKVLTRIENCFHKLASWKSFLEKWGFTYKGSFKNESVFKQIWLSLPKYMSWNIWLGRN